MVEVAEITLDRGGHATREKGVCATEMVAWLAGEPHTASPKCLSPVLRAFLQRLNDGLDDENRQRLKPYLERVIGTAGDGKDEARGWLATDWTVRVAAPIWLELAGVTESAAALRGLEPITDRKSSVAARTLAEKVRDEHWSGGWTTTYRQKIREAVKAELEERGLTKAAAAAAAAAVADTAADTAAVAAAVAAADAVADAVVAVAADVAADADADAVAAADAVADAVAAAAAVADAVAAADADGGSVYDAVYKAVRAKLDEGFKPANEALLPSALDLLERMIDPAPREDVKRERED